MKLSKKEDQARRILIEVAEGAFETHKPGLISYKELWELMSDAPWGRGKKNEIVGWITRISGYDLANGRPPLNELVVVKGQDEPGEEWSNIKTGLKQTFKLNANFKSHREAQEECWRYWGRQIKVHGDEAEDQAEEGYKQDRTVAFRKRNGTLIRQRKLKDNFTCQACGFRMEIEGKFLVDCHHKNPLGLVDRITVTRVDDLVCLCPTCHRIAHTKRYPLSVDEIQVALGR